MERSRRLDQYLKEDSGATVIALLTQTLDGFGKDLKKILTAEKLEDI